MKTIKLRKAIDRYVNAREYYSWRGNYPKEDHHSIEIDVVKPLKKLNKILNKLERRR